MAEGKAMHDDIYDHDHPDNFMIKEDEIVTDIEGLEMFSLKSVGIDIGSSTSHLIFSLITLRREGASLSGKFKVTNREVLYRSPIMLTPYLSATKIDTDKVNAFIQSAYKEAGLTPEDVDTGAVIITGEALKKENAQPIVENFAKYSGKFICAAAGHNHEALLAAYGCGAVDLSKAEHKTVLNVDMGGGTSDFSLVRVSPARAGKPDRSGDILATAGVHIGGTDFDRLLAMSRVMPELGLGTRTLDGKRHLPVAPYFDLSTWHRINRLYDPRALRDLRSTLREARAAGQVETFVMLVEERLGHRLIGAVEEAKIALSDHEAVDFAFPVRERVIATTLTIAQLADALAHSIERLEGTIGETLHRAGVGAGAVDSLILTGGSTLVPAVAGRLQAMFPEAEVVRTDVLGSVGLGLALEAKRVFG